MAFLAFIQRSILIRSCDVESHSDFSRNFTHLMGFKLKRSHFYWILAIDEISFRNCTKICKRRVHAEKSETVL